MIRTWPAAAIILAAGCAGAPPPPAAPAPAEAALHRDAPRVTALMINGGGNPSSNFAAHLAHLRELRELLLDGGVPSDRITLFSSDGADPRADLASREEQPEADFWRLHGTPLEHGLEMPIVLRSSEIPGAELYPATKAGIAAWFDQARTRLGAGDVLLLYVTDHGRRHGGDPFDNTLVLWDGDELSVRRLGEMIDRLDPAVRVVMLMSQCFSGAFAELSRGRPGGPKVCGYFAATADRPAYGCFPENRGKEKAGHAFQFIHALAGARRMEDAHAAVLAGDDTPDVPIKSSDVLLEDVLARAAKARSTTLAALVEEIVPDARATSDRALVEHIAASAGLDAPRSFAEVEAWTDDLPDLVRRLGESAEKWEAAVSDANENNLRGFVVDRPAWAQRLRGTPLHALDPPGTRAFAASLLADLAAWSRDGRGGVVEILHARDEAASSAWYRAEVRLAAALRIRTLLVAAAGRAYLARGADPEDQRAYEAVDACEDLTLPGAPAAAGAPSPPAEPSSRWGGPRAPPNPPEPFPSLAEDRTLERAVRPSWAGLAFEPVQPGRIEDQGLAEGAAMVSGVYAGSPASAAGIEVGDVVVGPPGRPFTIRGELRSWTMTSKAGEPEPLELLRGSARVTVTLTPREHPETLAPLPSPLVLVDRKGPPLDLVMYRGDKPAPSDKRPRLYFFWATWCKACKAALPELVAFERTGRARVIAVTDERAADLDAFFAAYKGPFPRAVALDARRRAFPFHGGAALPTFVLVDAAGYVRTRVVGYDRRRGIEVSGWRWPGR